MSNLFVQPGDDFQVSIKEAMLFSNGEAISKQLLQATPGSLVARLLQVTDLRERTLLAVSTVLNRPARAEEVAAIVEYMRQREERPTEACQQVVWALLASAEFRFNH
jgi:hypothetical protein